MGRRVRQSRSPNQFLREGLQPTDPLGLVPRFLRGLLLSGSEFAGHRNQGRSFFGLKGESMPKVSIKLSTELYRELQSAAASMQEPGYSAVNFITDVLTSDLASRRLPRMARERLGGRVTVSQDNTEPVSHSLCLPQLVS